MTPLSRVSTLCVVLVQPQAPARQVITPGASWEGEIRRDRVFLKDLGPVPGTARLAFAMSPRVKVCGITSREDLRAALDGGADALGFLVGQAHPSPDFVSSDLARELLRFVPPF